MMSSSGRLRSTVISGLGMNERQLACHRCRSRKKKCDRKRPICGECTKSGSECVILRPKKSARARDASSSYVHSLEDHIAALETRLSSSHPDVAIDHFNKTPGVNQQTAEEMAIGPLQNAWIYETEDEVAGFQIPFLDSTSTFYNMPWEQGEASKELDEPLDEPSNRIEELSMQPSNHAIHQGHTPGGPSTWNDREIVPLGRSSSLLSNGAKFSAKLADHENSRQIVGVYAQEYFQNAHLMWPFLHQQQWNQWWDTWQQKREWNRGEEWKGFFIDMVSSIGALTAQSQESSFWHEENSRFFYNRARKLHNSYAMQDQSPILRTQSSLLLTIRSMHLESVNEIFDNASTALLNCTISTLRDRKPRDLSVPYESIGDSIRRDTIRTCHVIDIIIAYSMDHSISFADEIVEEVVGDSSEESDSSPDEAGTGSRTLVNTSLADHIFQLRRIQSRILKAVGKVVHEAYRDDHPIPNLWRSNLQYELTQWTAELPRFYAIEENKRFLSMKWLIKLADYGLMSLFPNPKLAVKGGDASHLVEVASRAIQIFRQFRVKENTSCHTWTALLHQFQAGILILYCLWATLPHRQSELYDRRDISRALFACSATLVEFANRFERARLFRDVFDILTQAMPMTEFGDPDQQWYLSESQSEELHRLIVALRELKVHRKQIALLSEMASSGRPIDNTISEEEQFWIQYVA